MRLGAAVFAYGTLMSDEHNHEWACFPDAVEPASVQGKLYHMGYFPALLADGVGEASTDREVDALRSGRPTCPPEYASVQGELFWYTDDERAARAIRTMDRIEGFAPSAEMPGGYKRILLPALLSDGKAVMAWTYTRRSDEIYPEAFLTHGSWRRARKEIGMLTFSGELIY